MAGTVRATTLGPLMQVSRRHPAVLYHEMRYNLKSQEVILGELLNWASKEAISKRTALGEWVT